MTFFTAVRTTDGFVTAVTTFAAVVILLIVDTAVETAVFVLAGNAEATVFVVVVLVGVTVTFFEP